MRVLHIIGTLNPESGGPAASIATLNELRSPGSVYEVVTLDDPAANFLENFDLPVTALGPTRIKYGFNVRLLPWLRFNRDRFDGVIVHGLWQYCGLAAWMAFRGRTPYLVFVHGMLDPYFKHAFPLKHLKKWVYWIIAEYWVLRGAYRVLFTCAAEEQLARQSFRLHHWTSHVVPYGATVPSGDDSQRRVAFLSRFPQLRERGYLLFLGRIDRKKGCDLLIDAFIKSAALDPDLDLVMAGPDERHWRPKLEKSLVDANLSARVHWTGMLTGDEKWGAFLCSEAFILPSHQENFGIAVAEALACGKAVLLSDKVNIAPEIAADGAGLMEPDTVAGTQRLIERWIGLTHAQREAMSTQGLRTFASRYNLRNNRLDISNLLDQAAHKEPAGHVVSTSAAK